MVLMKNFTDDEKRTRAFERIATVLHGFWEEQQYDRKNGIGIRLNTRIFETLIYDCYICKGKSQDLRNAQKNGQRPKTHREHLVPCKALRNESFLMFDEGEKIPDVAKMLDKYLCISYITDDERKKLDKTYQDKMPCNDWRRSNLPETLRLVKCGITINPCTDRKNCSSSKNCL